MPNAGQGFHLIRAGYKLTAIRGRGPACPLARRVRETGRGMEERMHQNYPWWIVLVAQGASLVLYLLGAWILAGFGWPVAVLYLGFCAIVEFALLRGSCRHCHYYGRRCAFGRGRLCALLFPPGDPERFRCRQISLRDLLPDLLVPALPVAGGLIRLALGFDWALLAAVAATALVATAGAGTIRERLACPHCRQRELGCPAAQFFARRR